MRRGDFSHYLHGIMSLTNNVEQRAEPCFPSNFICAVIILAPRLISYHHFSAAIKWVSPSAFHNVTCNLNFTHMAYAAIAFEATLPAFCMREGR